MGANYLKNSIFISRYVNKNYLTQEPVSKDDLPTIVETGENDVQLEADHRRPRPQEDLSSIYVALAIYVVVIQHILLIFVVTVMVVVIADQRPKTSPQALRI